MSERKAWEKFSERTGQEAGKREPPRLPIPADPWQFVCDCVYSQDEHAKAKGIEFKQKLIADDEREDCYLKFLTYQWLNGSARQQWKKSRQIRVTWLLASLHLWAALHDRGVKVGYQSQKFEDADAYLKERFWFIYENIPAKYAKPMARRIEGVIEIFHDTGSQVPTSQILALAEGPDQVRQFTFTYLWRDEAASQADQKEAHGAAKPTLDGGGRDIKTSSSKGSRTFFYELAETDVAPGPMEEKRTVYDGITAWKRNGYEHLFIHYSADPKKRPGTVEGDKWIESAKEGQPTDLWRREMEGDDSIEPGVPVYCDTDRIKVEQQQVCGWLTFFRGWDFGYQWPFCYVVQIEPVENTQNLIVHVLRELVKPNTMADVFGQYVKEYCAKYFEPPARKWTDYGDDASKQLTDKGQTAAILQSLGITILSQPTGPGGILKRVTLVQRVISGGWLEIDPQCKYLIRALKSGYVRDDEGNPIGGEEGHPYADACDALGYCLVNALGLGYMPTGQQRSINPSSIGLPPGQLQTSSPLPLTTTYIPPKTPVMEVTRTSQTSLVPKNSAAMYNKNSYLGNRRGK